MSASGDKFVGHFVPLALAAVFFGASCGKNTTAMDGSVPPAPGPAAPGAADPAVSPHGPMGMGGGGTMPVNAWTVSGTVQLAVEFSGKSTPTDVLYVIARLPGERMPLAVERFPAPVFPLAYTLRSGHGTSPTDAPQALEVVAKLSRSGTAGPPQPGDLEGKYDGSAAPNATGVDITLNVQR
jgi:hypothetical protein